ncbi:hypothetical protein [Paraliomyxa miuraensis]|uniref:hypothetical protein n=1 Tax=Paraliomyxa miuraensis TaxID=376150 RepID=UPI00224F4A92|nr:hypothetical protein [Paraliomyxa miuraensis]MCX4240676.1 hypothetical protein [Paraliomyxa miuraensis]
MLRALVESGAEFLIVGAHAMAAHGVARATVDLDIYVRASAENAPRVIAALRAFGAPLNTHDVTTEDFEHPGTVYQLGLPPNRIDLLTRISGVGFEDAWASRIVTRVGDLEIPIIGRGPLLVNKRASGRDKDLVDVRLLETSDGT